MAGELTVIYTARTLVEAHQLQNLLAEVGIQAVVSNEALKGGLGGDILGWSAQPRVAVAEENAESARQIALEFDEELAALADSPPYEASEAERPAKRPGDWPRCPACGALRITRCPICGTAGSDFTEVDPDFVGMVDVAPDAKPVSCGCGSGGCSASPAASRAQEEAAAGEGAGGPGPEQPSAESPPRMLHCPTCEDPFVLQYARRCESCAHEFPDGYDPEPEANLDERLSARAIAVIVGLIVILIGLVAYFALIL